MEKRTFETLEIQNWAKETNKQIKVELTALPEWLRKNLQIEWALDYKAAEPESKNSVISMFDCLKNLFIF